MFFAYIYICMSMLAEQTAGPPIMADIFFMEPSGIMGKQRL